MNLSPDFVPPLTKEQCIFIFAIPIGFPIANQITRRRSKSLKASHRTTEAGEIG